MKLIILISMLLLTAGGMKVLRAQPAAIVATRSVLLVLRQPEGALGKRLAELPSSTPVPEEVRAAALREQTSLVSAQQESLDQRLTAAGATQVVHYPDLNMVRAEIPPSALSALHSDPAVLSVTPLSEDAPVVASGKAMSLPAANPVVGVPPVAGVAAGMLGHKFDALQPPSLSFPPQNGMPAVPPGPMNSPFMPPLPMPGMPGLPGTGGMFQSLLGVTGQMGMQAETAMPRSAGKAMLLSGTAQLAQVILASRKPGCTLTLATAGTHIPEAGGQGMIAVNAPPSCLWQAHSEAEWLQISGEGPVAGPGIIKYAAAPASAGTLRTGVINIVGVANVKVKGKTSITVQQGE